MRPVCLSRKDGSLPAATKAGRLGMPAWLIETCKLNGVNPQVYFADLIAAW